MIAIMGVSMCAACNQSEKDDAHLEEVSIGQEWIAKLANGTDAYQTDRSGDTTIYVYPDIQVKVVEKYEEPGENIFLINSSGIENIDVETGYFLGKVGKYLLIDRGTSTVRNLDVYELSNLEIVHSGISYREVNVSNGKVYYKTKIELDDDKEKPECSSELKNMGEDLLGYLQTVYFDLDSLNLVETTQVECAYFE